MTKTPRQCPPALKRHAAALSQTSGRPHMQIAAELGIQPSQLRRWQKAINRPGPRPTTPASGIAPASASMSAPSPASAPPPADRAAKNARLRRELDRARAERDILKKAIGIFSESPR